MAFELHHDVAIHAPAEAVWRVLTDFDSYPQWNPFARRVRCDLRPGGVIDMDVALVGRRPLRQREFITSVGPGMRFSYAMRPLPLGLLWSRRDQSVLDLGDGRSRYVASFRIGGVLAPVVRALLGRALRRGFNGVAATIGPRAEAVADAGDSA